MFLAILGVYLTAGLLLGYFYHRDHRDMIGALVLALGWPVILVVNLVQSVRHLVARLRRVF